ncbi:MAG: glycosyltransferase family 4 protein [bacterium]|nr:glycosyltransferase family 4 protein [bacterium]
MVASHPVQVRSASEVDSPQLPCADPAPTTLIVSWHWPPANRASTGVLASLFRDAPADRFCVVTRDLPAPPPEERIPEPSCATLRMRWYAPGGEEGTPAAWWASLGVVLRMLRSVRRLRRTRRLDCVLAVYPHRFSLLVGWWIARRTGLPLVAYMHDLFAETYQSGSWIKRVFWRWIDRRVLDDAAQVVVPTPEFADHYRGRGVQLCMVVPHCISADVPAAPSPMSSRTLRLVYTGSLYDAHEDSIRALLGATDRIENLELSLLTPPHPMLEGRPARWGSRADALSAVQQADVGVVVLGHDTPYPDEVRGCFPSKIVDYLAVGRPILAVVPPGCFVDRFVRASGAGVVVNTLHSADICKAIECLRDPELRARMASAALRHADSLRAEEHLARLMDALAELHSSPQRKGRWSWWTAAPLRQTSPGKGKVTDAGASESWATA